MTGLLLHTADLYMKRRTRDSPLDCCCPNLRGGCLEKTVLLHVSGDGMMILPMQRGWLRADCCRNEAAACAGCAYEGDV